MTNLSINQTNENTMSNLTIQYPELAAFFAKNAKDWESWNQDEAIIEALDSIEDKGSYELSGMYTISGNPEVLSSAE